LTSAPRTTDVAAVERELRAMLAPAFDGITIEIAHAPRWNRMAATFTWPGFNGLLPEERFHRLMTVIPEGFKNERMAGFIWLELAPGETIDELLKMPRSDDIAERELEIHDKLSHLGFFDQLGSALRPLPQKQCKSNFHFAISVLAGLNYDDTGVFDAKLLFIRHHAFCDCAILESGLEIRPKENSAPKSPVEKHIGRRSVPNRSRTT